MTTLFRARQALAKPADRPGLVSILADQVAAAFGDPAYIFVGSAYGVAWAAAVGFSDRRDSMTALN